jgi:hypothetical protein
MIKIERRELFYGAGIFIIRLKAEIERGIDINSSGPRSRGRAQSIPAEVNYARE